jgi:hypothetical protein
VVQEEQHLGIPVVGAERPAMVEDTGLALALVFVEDLDAVLGCNRVHGLESVAVGFCAPYSLSAGSTPRLSVSFLVRTIWRLRL